MAKKTKKDRRKANVSRLARNRKSPKGRAQPKRCSLKKSTKRGLALGKAAKPGREQRRLRAENLQKENRAHGDAALLAAVPQRAPRKIVLDAKAGIKVFSAQPPPIAVERAAAPEPIPEQDTPATEPAADAACAPVAPKVEWHALPEPVPLYLRALATFSAAECQRASSNPFPFARFVAELPNLIGGYEFLCLVLALEHNADAIAGMLRLETATVASACQVAEELLREALYGRCPETHRQWSAMLNGPGAEEQLLMERYLVPGVERGFQLLIGRLLLKALGARNPKAAGRPVLGKWSVNPRWLN